MDIGYSLIAGLLVILLLFVLVYFSDLTGVVTSWITWCRDIYHIRSLPSPPGRWFWGNALEVTDTQESLEYMQENHKKYPTWCVYWMGPTIPFVYTANLEIMKIILKSEVKKPDVYAFFRKWLGDGLAISSDEKWKRHRKLLTPAFHLDILKQYIPVFNEVSHKLLDKWSGLADSGESVEVTEHLHLYTLDVLMRCTFYSNSNCLEKEEIPYVTASCELEYLLMNRVFSPQYFFDWVYFSTAAGRRFLHCCDVVHEYSEEVIMKRREELLKGTQQSQPRKYLDFLDVLLSVKDENGKGLTDTEIREEVDTFMFAGHGTTASALGWIMYCLGQHVEHQKLCREEIREVLAGRDSDDITWEDLSKLSYTTMCIKESLRLYPLGPLIGKKLSEEIVAGGYRIPKGTYIGLGIYVMHHDPSVWSDPEKFDPLRFTIESCKKMDPFAYLAFSAGPRNCIGQRFALHELQVTTSHILNKFKLDVDSTHTVEPCVNVVYKARNGIKMKLSPAL
ncbi:cytochrome P450 4F6-like isoform X2 [Dysidea avara]|uniref:cytochrome P450 4F6-like isoform X2 n=1 Tax=Dysidea avara TaxID=196820 RepID=UPI00332D7610